MLFCHGVQRCRLPVLREIRQPLGTSIEAPQFFVDGGLLCAYEETVEPSCEFGGGVRHICSVCGSSYTEISTPALGHTPVAIPGTPATCTEAGITEGSKRSVCGEILTAPEDIAPLGHELEIAQPVDGENHSSICSRCQKTIIEPHSWDEGEVIKEATTSQTGEMRYTCTVCKATKTEPIPRLSSSSGGGSSSGSYTVSVVSGIDNGTVTVSPKSASKGDTVVIAVNPDDGYELDTLTVTDKNGDKISVADKGNGKYTFTMPSGKVTIDATFIKVAETPETPDQVDSFTDVHTNDWFANAVQYMLDNGMMNGVTDTTFAPNTTTTRSMIVTILYRLEGEPDAAASSFTDVAANMYYADAVAWAQANSIVTGITETTFAPDQSITREQMAAILYRYAQYKGYDVTASNDLSSYTDAPQISEYAITAMQWANVEGLITGNTNTTINPKGNATRAEVATILMRFCENIAQ